MRMRGGRGGVLLDAVVAIGLIVLAAFALSRVGIGFHEILNGAWRFFAH